MKHDMGEVKDTLTINGREAVTVSRAIDVLEEVTGHRYTRDSVYRMFERGVIQAERTEAANFYYVDSLRQFKREKQSGRRKGQAAHPESKRQQAIESYRQGEHNYATIADNLGATRQIVRKWILDAQKKENSSQNA